MAYFIYNATDGNILGVKYNLHNVQATISHYGSNYHYMTAPDDFGEVDYTSVIEGVAIAKNIDLYEGLRQQRDLLLQKSDWTQVSDAPVNQGAWATYRQALRDLPSNTSDPANPVWPVQPS